MLRVLAVIAACWVLCARAADASADSIDSGVNQLGGDASYKVRLAAALQLSKSRDPRAVFALAQALIADDEPTIRRVAALALERNLDARTPEDVRDIALKALDKAAASDSDAKVRDAAARTLRALAALRGKPQTRSDRPEVFVNIEEATDQSKLLPTGAGDRLARIVKQNIEGKGYVTTWPGGSLPTAAELSSSRARAFIVASTVKKIDITKVGGQAEIACTLAIRVAPWSGKDGGERWEANKAASATGSAKAMTGSRDRDIQSGVRDCLEAVAEDVTSRQVLPFLKRLAPPSS